MGLLTLGGRAAELLRLLRKRKRLLILTHTNPDPDSLASALGVRHLVNEKIGLQAELALSGRIMRAENKEMVRVLGLEMVPMAEVQLDRYDSCAVVDTQPGFGHTFIPEGWHVDIVIDHHVPPEGVEAPRARFEDVRTTVGATSTLVTSYLMETGVRLTPEVATALFYGIKTDTADLSRNVSPLDEKAYEFLAPKIDRQKLAAITNPSVPLDYFRTLRSALNNIRLYGNVVLCSMGKTSAPEMVAEVADLLLRLEGKQAVFCGGLVGNTYYVSVRTEMGGRDAYYLIRDALGGEGSFGGHGTVAGGSVVLPDDSPRTLKRLERRLEKNILRAMGVEGVCVSGLGE